MEANLPRWTSAASYALAALCLILIMVLHLLPALIAGLLVYVLVDAISPLLESRLSGDRARALVVGLLSAIIVGLLVLLIVGGVLFFKQEVGDPKTIFERLMPLIDKAREQLPASLSAHLPHSSAGIRASATQLAQTHSAQLQLAGRETLHVFGRILVGLILGALVALAHERPSPRHGPLRRDLTARCSRLTLAFRNIVFAQVKIAAINTIFTAIFLLVALPLMGVYLPLTKTLIVITFVVGLLPVVGNLISNTLIVIVALSVSLWVALAALIFLVLIHKFEYFLNAKIVGGQIRARAWEILLAMLVMEAAFGLPGVVAAPIYYAYLKNELEVAGLI
ncbi:MAG TPA: AI-2E family transporter [Rhodanobacteraceae bacterium]|nr:AI-2E family transporter [Rhodanobacteraceae bacterium]